MVANSALKTRRDLLWGGGDHDLDVRPLGARPEHAFRDTCTQCGDCARACPEHIIRRGEDGFPSIDFAKGACTFCEKCTQACEAGALEPATSWPYRAGVAQNCLSLNAVHCRVCQDQCEAQAISFQLATGGRAAPIIDVETCTGCGACVAPCPVQAISVQTPNAQSEVHA